MPKLTYEETVYTFDIDFAGHVNNAVYLRWLEEGRTKLLEGCGFPIQELVASGTFPVLAHTEIYYKRALFLGDSVRIEGWVSKPSKARIFLDFEVYNQKGELAAHAHQTAAFVDGDTMRPRRLTKEEVERLNRFLLP
ncbi:MAG: acyl-CoA thioesterase [Candidatus Omnitrophica bacterium]|nr:acyl-CoA thioesterase [Candidatus Omnitrophota bacterium]MCA9440950.1 acyl-CoA thioesterase [Candidatus Omnitrophota bacterium]MCA9447269.1 acyl-CoA thioesterase [Candidatus Omnitrophota bacterium]